MATSNNRDVKLTLLLETLGQESVDALRQSVQRLADQGGEAQPKFQALLQELDKLADSNDAVQEFDALAVRTADLAQAQSVAAERAEVLQKQLTEQRAVVEQATASHAASADALRRNTQEIRGYEGELAKLRSTTDAAGKKTDEYKIKLADLIDAKTRLSQEAVALKASLDAEKVALDGAAAMLKRVQKEYDGAAAASSRAGDAYGRSNSALEAARAGVEKLGLATEDTAALQTQLVNEFNKVGQQAQALQQAVVDAAQAHEREQAELKDSAEAHRALLQSLNSEIALRKQMAGQRRSDDAAAQQAAAAIRLEQEALAQAAAAARAKAAADEEMAEHNRLLAIQQQATNEALRAGADALHAETAAIREATQAASLYQAAKAEQAAAERAAAEEAERAAGRIDNAFKTVGVRSVEALQQEIAEVRAAMATLGSTAGISGNQIAGAFAAGAARIKGLEREIREVTGSLTLADRASKLFANSMGQIAAGNLLADAIASIVERVKDMAREFIASIVAMDQLRRGLNAIYKDANVTAQQIQFLRMTARDAGVSFSSLSSEFVKFSAALTSAGVPLDQSNALISSLVSASASLGLGAEAVAGSLNALGQMASKGCHAPGTLIRMADGHVRAVEQVAVGDLVLGPDGYPRRVLETATGTEVMYRIVPREGDPFVVNRSHKLRLMRHDGSVDTVMLRDWLFGLEGVESKLVLDGRPVGFRAYPVGVGTYHGFVLNGDHLYLDAQGFEHHNTVSMEELRQQLGDRLPGSFGLVAKGLGLTQAELVKLVESGGLAATDLFPALTKALQSLRGETEGLVPTWERLKGAMTETAQAAGDAGWTEILNSGLQALAVVLGAILVPLQGFFELLGGVARSAGVLAGALATLSNPTQALSDIWEASGQRLASLQDAFLRIIGVQDEAAGAAGRLGAASDGTGNAYVALKVKLTSALADQQKMTVETGKAAEAVKIQGETLEALARIQGDQIGILNAATLAADANQAATARQTASRREEVAILQSQLEAFDENVAKRGGMTEALQKERAEIEKKIAAAEVEVEKSQALTDALAQEAESRRLAAELYADNSRNVGMYADALAVASRQLEMVQSLHTAGLATDQDLMSARRALAETTARYNDAVSDREQRELRLIQTMEANNRLEQARMNLQMASLDAQRRQAEVDGDTYKVRQLAIAQKELEIRMVDLSVQGQIAEANAKIASLRLTQQELDLSDPVQAAKSHVIDLSIKAAEISILEARARGEVVTSLQEELKALKESSLWRDSNTASVRRGKPALDDDTDARHRNSAAIDKQTSSLKNQQKLTSDGLPTNADGSAAGTFGNILPMDVAAQIVEKMRRGALSAEDLGDARTAMQQVNKSRDWLNATLRNSPGAVSIEAQQSTNSMYAKVRGALEQVEALARAESDTKSSATAGTTAPATTGTPSKTVTVKLQLNGKTETVTAADQASADALIRALQQASLAAS